MIGAIQWRLASEMPDDLNSAFLCSPGMKSWMIAHRDDGGKWRAAFGSFNAEVINIEKYYFIPLSVIPELPTSAQNSDGGSDD
jgi:hypothetical protein